LDNYGEKMQVLFEIIICRLTIFRAVLRIAAGLMLGNNNE